MRFHATSFFLLVVGTGAALLGTAPEASARTNCPGLRAVNRAPVIVYSTNGVRCRRVFSIFGLQIGIGGGGFCPDTVTVTPAHRECESFANSNTDCEPVASVEVRVRTCTCVTQSYPDLGVSEAECSCIYSGSAGMVWDHETIACGPRPGGIG